MAQNRMKRTLTIVNTTLTEPKTALAGVTLEISFARFIASMDTFNVERRPLRPLGRCEFVAIVKTGGRCREKAWQRGCGEESCHRTPRGVRESESVRSIIKLFTVER